MNCKYFAIRRGYDPGIYHAPYEVVRPLVHGYPGAAFAGFSERRPAEIYMSNEVTKEKAIEMAWRERYAEQHEAAQACKIGPSGLAPDRSPLRSSQRRGSQPRRKP